ncbi:hypothetical protein B0T16DRAFT_421026 [Cercophora newfieldiana]|uniref:Uncharacterized protein n=1 Tax=Cercophora newfieldiana TaxID=92897 RepID=A0AA39XZB8_9PEZI|nr:hypothetical protein B0T16DRAFT_421026 [Cercophora newfieldiana]
MNPAVSFRPSLSFCPCLLECDYPELVTCVAEDQANHWASTWVRVLPTRCQKSSIAGSGTSVFLSLDSNEVNSQAAKHPRISRMAQQPQPAAAGIKLPMELLLAIVENLYEPELVSDPDQEPADPDATRSYAALQDLRNVCLASKQLRDIAQPIMYQELALGYGQHHGSDTRGGINFTGRLVALANTLVARPDLAARMLRVFLHPQLVKSAANGDAETILATVRRVERALEIPAQPLDRMPWKLALLLQMLTVFLLPNLEHLAAGPYPALRPWNDDDSPLLFINGTVEMLQGLGYSLDSFKHLRSVEFVNCYRPSFSGEAYTPLDEYLRCRNIEMLTVRGSTELPFSKSSDHTSIAESNLKHLRIVDPKEVLWHRRNVWLFELLNKLESFYFASGPPARPHSILDLMMALKEGCGQSLRHLHLDLRFSDTPLSETSLLSFKIFSALETLAITAQAVRPGNDVPDSALLGHVLPSSLERLTFLPQAADFSMYDALRGLRGDILNGLFPRLKQIRMCWDSDPIGEVAWERSMLRGEFASVGVELEAIEKLDPQWLQRELDVVVVIFSGRAMLDFPAFFSAAFSYKKADGSWGFRY